MQKNNKIESIDQHFSSKLSNHKVVPPPEIWEGIVAEMDTRKRKKRAIWIIALSSAASLLLAFLAGWYFSENISETENQVAIEMFSNQDKGVNAQDENKIGIHKNDADANPPEMVSINELAPDVQQFDNLIKTSDSKNNKNQNHDIRIEASGSEIKAEKLGVLKPLKIFLSKTGNHSPQLIAMNTDEFSDYDRKIIEANLRNMPKEIPRENKGAWLVGLQASPAYRFEQGSTQTEKADIIYSVNQTGRAPKYITNMTGGVKFEYKTGKRFSIQSGVNYGEIAQSNGNVGVSFLGHNWLNDYINSDEFYYAGETEKNSVPVPNNAVVATNIGLANIEMPEGTQIELTNREPESNYASEIIQNTEFEQQAGYIEVPLIMTYTILQKRIGLYVLGGINTNFLTSNSVELVNNNEVVGSGKIEGLNPLTFSSSLGMGLNYSLGSHFNLSVEPTMKIMLNSLNSEAIYETRPYTVGIYTALLYRF
ncbi:MAG: hypothetical protein JW798_10035 [Prolixibacteraceae bacterium]|nr:hypothetical protein [Prolixibacteraceae bacterium]